MKANNYFFGVLFSAYFTAGGLFAGTLSFQPVVSLDAGVSPRAVMAGDLFGNGTKEFITADFGSPTFIGLSTPASQLDPQNSMLQVFSPSSSGLRPEGTIPTGLSPRGLCLFNLTGKGRADILVADYGADLVQVFEWGGSGFSQIDQTATLNEPVGIAAGLTRAGGVPFVVVADYGANSISIFPVKNGKLGTRVDIPVPAGPTQVAIGDLNGDGFNEIAVACLPADKIEILSVGSDNPAGYAHLETLTLPDGSAPSDLRLADLNHDGKTDLAVADFTKNQLLIYLQQAGGTLAAQPALPTSGSHPNGMTVADLDGDGIPEIIVANRDSDTLDIFQSAGPSYQLAKTLAVANDAVTTFGPVEVAVLDTTGQGRMYLVTSHMRSNTIKVLAQSGAASSSNVNAEVVVLGGKTPTPTPDYWASQVTLAPVPVKAGQPLCLFAPDKVQTARLQVYNLIGERIADVSFQGTGSHCWSTLGTAPGIYIADVNLVYGDGSTANSRRKILITR